MSEEQTARAGGCRSSGGHFSGGLVAVSRAEESGALARRERVMVWQARDGAERRRVQATAYTGRWAVRY